MKEPRLSSLTLQISDSSEKKNIEDLLKEKLEMTYGVFDVYVEETDIDNYIQIELKIQEPDCSKSKLESDIFLETGLPVKVEYYKKFKANVL